MILNVSEARGPSTGEKQIFPLLQDSYDLQVQRYRDSKVYTYYRRWPPYHAKR